MNRRQADAPAVSTDLEGRRHRWGPPPPSFTVQSSDGWLDVHGGPTVTLDRVLRWETHEEDDLSLTFDRVVWEGDQVVAIIRFVEGRQPYAETIPRPEPIPWTKPKADDAEGPGDGR